MGAIDYRAFKHNGNAYTLIIVPDDDIDYKDADCYTQDDIDAYREGRWRFVGIIVRSESGDDASVWGCEFGTIGTREITADTFVTDDYYAPALAREIEEGKS